MKDAVLTRLFLRWRARGDGAALAAVFDLAAQELLAVATHLVRDAAEAEDLVQVVFLRAMERAAAFDPAQGLRGWLHGILWREALAARRRAARRVEPARLARAAEDPADAVERAEVPDAVRTALAGLPRRYREVVEPLLLDGKPAHVVAAELGRSSGTVRMQLHRGLDRLRRALPRGLALSGGVLLPARGLREVREAVLREAGRAPGASPASAGPLATGALVAQAAVAAAPALVLVPVVTGGVALAAAPLLFPPAEPAPHVARANPKETDMTPSRLLAWPLALGLSAAAVQEGPGREPVAAETVAETSARLDALVGELLALSAGGGPDARAAWAALDAARRRIEAEARRRREAEWALVRAGADEQRGWVEAAAQLHDAARRAAALREIEAALRSGDPARQLAACGALAQLGEVKFDKAPFREPVLAIARSATGKLRVSALYALWNVERRPEDLALALALADDDAPAARESGLHLLQMFAGGDLTGEVGAAGLRILEALDGRQGLNGIWGARVSPEIEAHLLALSRASDRETSHDAIYFGLSTLEGKSRAVVERLIEAAGVSDPNVYQRALWGLGHGVPAEHGRLVADAMRAFFEARSGPRLQTQALELVGAYGSAADVPWLSGIAADAAQPDAVREAARAALAAVEGR